MFIHVKTKHIFRRNLTKLIKILLILKIYLYLLADNSII